jgi:hypothetical protein
MYAVFIPDDVASESKWKHLNPTEEDAG